MPSLPELEVYKHQLTPRLAGLKITAVRPLDYRVVHASTQALDDILAGHSIKVIHRYGKWLYLDTGHAEHLIIHLGLTGKLKVIGSGDKLPANSCLEVSFDSGDRLVLSDSRKLGKVYVRDFADLKAEKELGPDLLDTTEDYFVSTLRRKRRGARDVLMDQHIIAGIGGKYADEMLWQAKLHPNVKLDRLTEAEVANLYRIMNSVTDTAISLDGDVERFPDNWLIPHRKTDKRCPRCGAELTERSLGGSASYYCPTDQPAPNPYRRG